MESQYYGRERQSAMTELISAGLVESWVTSDNVTHIGLTANKRQYELEVKVPEK